MDLKLRLLYTVTIFWIFLNIVTTINGAENPSSQFQFCHDRKLYSFDTNQCPGGVRFVIEAVQPTDDCICSDGVFATVGTEFGADISVISGKKNKCTVFNENHYIKRDTIYSCRDESYLSRWQVIPLSDSGVVTQDWISLWSDPSQLGEFKEFRRFPLKRFTDKMVYGKKDSFVGNLAVITSKDSTSLQLPFGGACLSLNTTGGQVYFFDEISLSKTDPGATENLCTGTADNLIQPRQIAGADSELSCELSPDCEEHEHTHARFFPDHHPTSNSWSTYSEDERKYMIRQENVQLVEFRMRMEHQGAQVLPTHVSHRLDLINMSKTILQKGTADIVPSSLIETAFKLFHYLYFDVDSEDELQNVEFKKIMYSLEQCLHNLEPLTFGKSGCPSKLDSFTLTMAKGVTTSSFDKSQIPADRIFDPLKNDALVEIMWKAVDFTHSQCFEYFFQNNLHHYFENQVEKLFLMEPIQYRWNRDIPYGMKLYGPILPKLDLQTMENLDLIVGSVQLNKVYDNWLKKPALNFEKAQDDAEKGEIRKNLNGYKIWGGIAYCLQLNPFDGEVARTRSKAAGLYPALSDISKMLGNGPHKCAQNTTA